MQGFGGFGANAPFGASQPAQSPFGTGTSTFGQPASPFGQTSAFGSTSTGMFSPAPVFGATSTPAFGASSTPAFGAGSTFGAKPATGAFSGFGSAAPNPFGTSTPAFGAPSTAPAFGVSTGGAFGATATPSFGGTGGFGGFGGTSAFGATSTPAFGVSSTPAFGATPTPAFGSTTFGAPGAGAFGQQQQNGTRTIPFQRVQEVDGSSSTGSKTPVYLQSISAMQPYSNKSFEELRWEDYQAGVKGNTGVAPAAPAFGSSPFGSTPASTQMGFGATPASSNPFGATLGGFGSTTPAFGSTTPAFGASTPAFGSTTFGSSTPAFGATPTPAFGSTGLFGSTTPAFGTSTPAFGASSSPAFGATPSLFGTPSSTPAFGATPTPTFGGFGQTSTPAFGATSAPAFGSTTFGAPQTPSLFGAASTPAFGAPSSTPAFSFSSTPAFGANTAASPFGATSTPAFGATSTPAFGSSIFGSTQQKPFGQGLFGATTPASPFGTPSSTPAFGASPSPGGFFGQSPGLFGQTPASAAPFSFNLTGTAPQQNTGGIFGAQQQPQQQQLIPVQSPGVATSPWGTMPKPPEVGTPLPEHKVGISARPVSLGPPRPTALMSPRTIMPRSGVILRAGRSRAATRMATSTADFLKEDGTDGGSGMNGGVFVPRDDPRRFFIRDPLPSTKAAHVSTPAPSSTPAPPARTTNGASSEGPRRSSENSRADRNGAEDAANRSGDLGRGSAAENGAAPPSPERSTPRRQSPPRGRLSDEEISRQLPSLDGTDLVMEPSQTQLAAMARDDPSSLTHVANFTLRRKDVGSIRWLEPVDVRGLDLAETVRLTPGTVTVYLDDEKKPDVGWGLNKPAEITLLKVFRMDKGTGEPTQDADRIEKYIAKLKKIAAQQDSRFISYDPKGGVWRFEVSHFSRYGLVGEEDSDDEMAGAAPHTPGTTGIQDGSHPAASGVADIDDGEDGMQESDDEDVVSMSQRGELVRSGWEGTQDTGDNQAAASPQLQVAFPAQIGLDPSDLADMRSSLFPSGSAAGFAAGPGGLGVEDSGFSRRSPAASMAASVKSRTRARPQGRRAWVPTPSAISAPPPSAACTYQPPPQPTTPPTTLARPVGFPTASPSAANPAQERSVVDVGLLLGRTSRVGWGTNGRFVHTDGTRIVISRLAVNAALAPERADPSSQRAFEKRHVDRWRRLLEMHQQWSHRDRVACPGPGVSGHGAYQLGDSHYSADFEEGQSRHTPMDGDDDLVVPRWRLHCDRKAELHALCIESLILDSEFIEKNHIHPWATLEGLVIRHGMWTWQLLEVLFTHIAGEDDVLPLEGEEAMNGGPDVLMVPEASGSDSGEVSEDGDSSSGPRPKRPNARRLADYQRRAELSRWLQERAKLEVEGAVQQGGTTARHLAHLLAGNQIGAAVALAASIGDVRLAAAICQVAASSAARGSIGKQLEVWDTANITNHVDPDLLLVYRLLAGKLDEVILPLSLEWRRALATHLWYGKSPDTPLTTALSGYTEAVRREKAPFPLPLYAERRPQSHAAAQRAGYADTHFHLLQLAAGSSDSCTSDFSARLFAPAGSTPDHLDHMLMWQLSGTLSALHNTDYGIEHADGSSSLLQIIQLHASMICQLEAVRLPQWAVYVALHIPDAPSDDPPGEFRTRVVRDLLDRYAPLWASDAMLRGFLVERCGLSTAWLADSLALWAGYNRDWREQLHQLLAGRRWADAHAVLVDCLAPTYLLGGCLGELKDALSSLAHHEEEIEAVVGAIAWRTGGALYVAYCEAEEMCEVRNLEDMSEEWEPTAPDHAAAWKDLYTLLMEASALPDKATGGDALSLPDEATTERVRRLRLAVLGMMTQDVIRWMPASYTIPDTDARTALSLPLIMPDDRWRQLQFVSICVGSAPRVRA